MNHPFVPLKSNPIVCASCTRSMRDHLASATCEQCARIELCDLVNNVLLCASCKDTALEAARTNGILPNAKVLEYDMPESVKTYNIARSITEDLPANGSEFYNAKVIAIVELEARINADSSIENKPVFFAQQIQARQSHLYKTLIEVRELVTEINAERHANYRALNALASRLRKEERERLNIKYAEYVPSSKVKSVRQPRKSAEDNLIESMAKLMFAPRIDGIIQWEALEGGEREGYIQKAKQYYKGTLK